jgi:cephalosporin hydroxylase
MMKELVLDIVSSCNKPTGDFLLDTLFDKYNEASPRDDSPVYYRFLYELGKRLKDKQPNLIEVGCKYGAASLHFLKGGGYRSVGIDVADIANIGMFEGYNFTFRQDSSTNPDLVSSLAPADFVFIDTDHTYEQTKREFELWVGKVKPGGLLLFDDILAKEYGCAKFWQELQGDKMEFEELHPVGWGFGVYFL